VANDRHYLVTQSEDLVSHASDLLYSGLSALVCPEVIVGKRRALPHLAPQSTAVPPWPDKSLLDY